MRSGKLLKHRGVQFGIALVVAICFFLVLAVWGRAGDCKPQERDGQCGLSSFIGVVFGGAGALTIVAGTLIWMLVASYRARSSRPRDPYDR